MTTGARRRAMTQIVTMVVVAVAVAVWVLGGGTGAAHDDGPGTATPGPDTTAGANGTAAGGDNTPSADDEPAGGDDRDSTGTAGESTDAAGDNTADDDGATAGNNTDAAGNNTGDAGDSTDAAWVDGIGVDGRTFLGVTTASSSDEELDAFAEAAGRSPDAVLLSRDLSGPFDVTTVERLWGRGALPIVSLEPWNHADVLAGDRARAVQPDYALARIIDGTHDAILRDWARDIATWGRPLGLRFAHEMNGYWYPWAESANGNSPGEYVIAWRRVHDLFAAEGADNVIWIWSPNLTQPSLTPLEQLYPGDAYVDWVGLVGYLGNGIDPRVWQPSFGELFGPTIDVVRSLTSRPLVVTEIGATEVGGHKAEWITGALAAVAADPDIIGLVWFELDKETDWRIVSSPEASAAFAAGVTGSGWGIPRDLSASPSLPAPPP